MLKFSNYYLGRVSIEFFSNLKILINISANKLEFFYLFLFSFFVIGLETYSLSIFYTVSNLTLNENYIYKNYFLDFFNSIIKTILGLHVDFPLNILNTKSGHKYNELEFFQSNQDSNSSNNTKTNNK